MVLAGEGNDHILARDVGLLQEVGVGDVALVDDRLAESGAQLAGPLRSSFDHADVEAAGDEGLGQQFGGAATAEEERPGGHVAGEAEAIRDIA